MKKVWSLCVFLGLIFIVFPIQARVVEKILAIVNNEIITKIELKRFKDKLRSNGLLDGSVLRLKDTKALLKDRKSLINHLIDERVLDSEVKKQGHAVTINKVEREIRNIARRNGVDRKSLNAALAEKNIAFSEYQHFIRTSLERQSLIDKEVSSKIKISEDDISSYYVNQMGDKSTNVFEYTLAHILFQIKKGKKEARKRAQWVKDKIKSKSASFEKLASQFSEDPNFSQGGLLGTFKSGEMLPAMEKAIRRLNEGEITDIIKTPIGLHLVKLTKKKLVPNPDYESKKEEIRALLFEKAFKRRFRNWLDDKRQNSFIRIN